MLIHPIDPRACLCVKLKDLRKNVITIPKRVFTSHTRRTGPKGAVVVWQFMLWIEHSPKNYRSLESDLWMSMGLRPSFLIVISAIRDCSWLDMAWCFLNKNGRKTVCERTFLWERLPCTCHWAVNRWSNRLSVDIRESFIHSNNISSFGAAFPSVPQCITGISFKSTLFKRGARLFVMIPTNSTARKSWIRHILPKTPGTDGCARHGYGMHTSIWKRHW